MKNKLLPFFLLLLCATWALGQTDTIYYYNDNGYKVEKDSASWYRKVHFTNYAKGECTATDYYTNGVLARSEGPYIQNINGIYPNGIFTNYTNKGKKDTYGTYICDFDKGLKGKRIGKWIEYNDQEKPKWEYNYEGIVKDDYNDELVINYWDSTGKQMLANGNGPVVYKSTAEPPNDTVVDVIISSVYKNGKLNGLHQVNFAATGKPYIKEDFLDGVLVKGTSYDAAGKEYTYTKFEEQPRFPGADAGLMQFLKEHIEYPKYERKHDIGGRVLLRFVVDEKGHVTDVEVKHSVSKGIDAEAVKVVKALPDFSIGRRKGQPVSVYFNLPVVFRLQ